LADLLPQWAAGLKPPHLAGSEIDHGSKVTGFTGRIDIVVRRVHLDIVELELFSWGARRLRAETFQEGLGLQNLGR